MKKFCLKRVSVYGEHFTMVELAWYLTFINCKTQMKKKSCQKLKEKELRYCIDDIILFDRFCQVF